MDTWDIGLLELLRKVVDAIIKNLPYGKCPPPRRPTWVPRREGNGDGNIGVEDGAGVGERGPGPLFLVFLDL